MSSYPQTGSLLQSRINSGLSTNIKIKVGNATVGAIQRLQINQTRDVAMWEEVGTDGKVDSHHKGAANVNLSVSRIVFDQMRLTEAFGRGFVNLQAQRFHFNIDIIDLSADDPEIAPVYTFHNCLFRTISTSYEANNFIITENGELSCEYVTASVNGESIVYGGLRGIPYDYDSMERSTDSRGKVGAIDPTGQDVRKI
jgi:hypothetical protein